MGGQSIERNGQALAAPLTYRSSVDQGRLVHMTDVRRDDANEDGAPRDRQRKFRQMPNLVVPQDFDAPLPEDEYAPWEDGADGERWLDQPGITESIDESESDDHVERLQALRAALIDGECSGASTPFDFHQFVDRKRNPGNQHNG